MVSAGPAEAERESVRAGSQFLNRAGTIAPPETPGNIENKRYKLTPLEGDNVTPHRQILR